MSYIDLLNEFNRWLESNMLPARSQLLYYKLLHVFNRAGWPESVQLDNLRLMVLTGIRSVATVIHARDQLVEAGFISFIKGKKGEPNRYTLIKERRSAAENSAEKTMENASESELEKDCDSENATEINTEIDTENCTENETVSESTNDKHNKNKNKTKNKTKTKNYSPLADARGEYSPPRRTEEPFVRPTVEEVRQYAAEHGCNVDAECFVSYYDSVGWLVGGVPMRDWKAAVRAWDARERRRSSERFGRKDIPRGASGTLGAAEMEAIQWVMRGA